MQEYTLKYVNVFKTNKDGQSYKTSDGKPFVRVSVKVEEYGEAYISGLFFGADCPWKVGDKQVLIISKEIYQGKEQLKFEIPKKKDAMLEILEDIKLTNKKLEWQNNEIIKGIQGLYDPVKPLKGNYPTPESEGLDPDNMANFEPDESTQ